MRKKGGIQHPSEKRWREGENTEGCERPLVNCAYLKKAEALQAKTETNL